MSPLRLTMGYLLQLSKLSGGHYFFGHSFFILLTILWAYRKDAYNHFKKELGELYKAVI